MTVYTDARDYIAEERRQMLDTIREIRRRLSRRAGRRISYEDAKQDFLRRRLETFARAYRAGHRVRS